MRQILAVVDTNKEVDALSSKLVRQIHVQRVATVNFEAPMMAFLVASVFGDHPEWLVSGRGVEPK